MICRLWEFQNDTDCQIDIVKDCNTCSDGCEYYNNGCGCCEDLNVVLTHSRHGWTISRRLWLESDLITSGQLQNVVLAVKLISASEDPIWVAIKEKNDKIMFLIIDGDKVKVCDTLGEANFVLRDTNNYNGRKLTMEDIGYDHN